MPKTAKNDLTPLAKEWFRLPETAQEFEQQFSMVNFVPIYEPLLDVLRPAVICEIGSEEGGNTRYLAEFCHQNDCMLHVVDIAPEIQDLYVDNDCVEVHAARSIDFLQGFSGADVYFVDGDHNYQTVLHELHLIEELVDEGGACLFLHDIGWPCGFRDMYYDLAMLDGEPHPCEKGIGLDVCDSGYSEDGVFAGSAELYALREGGKENGLLAALDAFLTGSAYEWAFIDIPSLYGMGVLYLPDRLSAEQRAVFERFKITFDALRPFLATLEWGRILLLESVYEEKHRVKLATESRNYADEAAQHAEEAKQQAVEECQQAEEAKQQAEEAKRQAVEGRQQAIGAAQRALGERESMSKELAHLYSSRSWRITAPLRYVERLLR